MIYCTTVYRGVTQGRHGILYEVDIDTEEYKILLDYDDEIDYSGRGGDRGLRGITKIDDHLYVCASKAVLKLDLQGNILDKIEHKYLGWLHEILADDLGFSVVSTMYDSVLHYNIERSIWDYGIHVNHERNLSYFIPDETELSHSNMWHLNSISEHTLSGLRFSVTIPDNFHIPAGTHNTRVINGSLFYNDTEKNTVRFDNKSYEFKTHSFLRGATLTNEILVVGQTPASLHVFDHDLHLLKSIQLSDDKNVSVQSVYQSYK